MRNASFRITEKQILDGTKTVTRRLGWAWCEPGERIMACRQCMGRKGEPLVRLREIEVLNVRREPLNAMTMADKGVWAYTVQEAQEECRREGFPDMTPEQFVEMFCEHMNCAPETMVTRIEFRFL